MDSIDGTEWDLVLSSTSLLNSLLGLSLSRSGQPSSTRILHLDQNDYYGGDEAAFSRSEAEAWAKKHASADSHSSFSRAAVLFPPDAASQEGAPTLASPRAYSLTLSPQLIYARSHLVSAMVSSQIHNQLDFQAVGSWFVLHPHPPNFSLTRLMRVPSGREDIFSDTSLDLRSKRGLMKFLRFVGNYEEHPDAWESERHTPFPTFLEHNFGLPPSSHAAILSLTMSDKSPASTTTEFALPRIARHIRSIGVFGPGFGAVLPKWGGLAEIVQVACRACAVGGGTYILNKSISSREKEPSPSIDCRSLVFDNCEKVTARWLVGGADDLRSETARPSGDDQRSTATSRSISIVSSPLTSLFPRTSEGGPIPAGAVIMVPGSSENDPPVYILAHTSEAGECPMNQCIFYASVPLPADAGFPRIEQAVDALLDNVDERAAEDDRQKPVVLWSMKYQQRTSSFTELQTPEKGVVVFPTLSSSLVLDDAALEKVKLVWKMITGEDDEKFMQFEPREGSDLGDDS